MKAISLTTLLCLSPGPPQLINKSLGKHSSLPLPGFWRLLGTPSPAAASLQTLSHLYMPDALCLVSVSFPLLRRKPVFGCGAHLMQHGVPRWLSGKEPACNVGDVDLISGSGRSPGQGNGNPLQYSCLGNPVDRGAEGATVYGLTKESDTIEQLNNIEHDLLLIIHLNKKKTLVH